MRQFRHAHEIILDDFKLFRVPVSDPRITNINLLAAREPVRAKVYKSPGKNLRIAVISVSASLNATSPLSHLPLIILFLPARK